jgi:polyisoprenoid-binding protein YceI
MMISNVKGQFANLTGTLTLDETDITNSRVEAAIEAASVNTRDPQRDTHLKSEDFFHAEKFPKLSFKSTRITRTADPWWSQRGRGACCPRDLLRAGSVLLWRK